MAHLLISLMAMAILFEFSSSFSDRRVKRHADGLFTSELSKMKNDVAVRSFLKSLLHSKRSVPEMNFPDNVEDNETRSEEACFNCLYQRLSDQEAAQESYKLICQPLGHLLQNLEDYNTLVKSPERNL